MSFENKAGKLTAAIESCGGFDNFMDTMLPELIEAEKGKTPLMQPEDFSLKEISEAVNTSQFPILTGSLLAKKVMDAYNQFDSVLSKLVTPFKSNLQTDRIAGAYLKGDLEEIAEGAPYPHSGDIAEKYVTVGGTKRGEILDVTEENVKFDQTGLVMMRASQFGNRAAVDRERRGMYTIQDATVDGVNHYAWYPSGTRIALYSDTASGAHRLDNNIVDVLGDYTDIAAADALLGVMTDENEEPIMAEAKILLVPRTLKVTALRIIKNEYMPANSGSSVGFMEKNPFANTVEVLVSPFIDKVSANDWYYGDFKKQYVEKIIYPIQVLSRKDNKNDDAWERDIVASFKVRHFTQVAAVDFCYVIKSTGEG